MKKFILLFLSIIFIATMISMPVNATSSPEGESFVLVCVKQGMNANSDKATVRRNAVFSLSSIPDNNFNSWSFYKNDGTLAEENVDYVFVTGNKNCETVELKLLNQIIICGNYNGEITYPDVINNNQDSSPKTGDFSFLAMLAVFFLSGGLTFKFAKKLI